MPNKSKMKGVYHHGSVTSRSERIHHTNSSVRQQQTKSREAVVRMSALTAPPPNPLQEAVFRGCIECIRVLVETPPYYRVDAPCGPDGLRLTHIAAAEGHLHVLRYLASVGASLEKCDASGRSGLHHAVISGQLRAVRWLLRHGAQITLDRWGRSPVQVATDLGHTEIVTVLVNHSSCGISNLQPLSSPLFQSPNNQNYNRSITSNPNNSPNSSSTTTTIILSNNNTSGHHHKVKSHQRHIRIDESGIEKVLQSHQDSSSSGNSSLVTTTTSSGSNSPSLSQGCSCSASEKELNSDDNETVDYSTASSNTIVTIGTATTKISNQGENFISSGSCGGSFYLHPPKSVISVNSCSSSGSNEPTYTSGSVTNKTPFYLHLPDENSPEPNLTTNVNEKLTVSVHFEDEEENRVEMAPVTPVNSSSDYLPSKDSRRDEKSTEGSSSPTSSVSVSPIPSPPSPPPPPPKTGKVQLLKSAIFTDSPLPPPPPPPMPKFDEKPGPWTNIQSPIGSPLRNRLPNPDNYAYNDGLANENDYEDIDEMEDDEGKYEKANLVTPRKLNRSVSAPPPPSYPQNMIGSTDSTNKPTPPELPPLLIQPKGVSLGMRRPFIPPNFPDPPKDALIKPSEYLKSIQQKPKFGKALNSTGSGGYGKSSSSRIEETIKLLNGSEMPPVPEESNGEDEETTSSDGAIEKVTRGHLVGADSTAGIRPEELMKVNLRKTPMSRTLSAPPLGRVLPDINGSNQSSTTPEEVKRTPNPLVNGKLIQSTSTRAAIIAELAESSQVGGVREWKEELRRRQLEEDKTAAKEIASIYSSSNFVAEIPNTDGSGAPIPPWKRQMMAKKAAEKAKKEAEEQRKLEAEAKRASAIPPWKRQLMQRKDGDGKGAQ